MILSVSRPVLPEFDLLHEGQILCGFLHLAVAHPAKLEILLERKITAIAYETIQIADGHLPVLTAASQIAGRMIATIAAQLLQNNEGGHGILLGGVPGVPPAKVVILGAGMVGTNAARMFQAMGAHVTVLDADLRKLQALEEHGSHRANHGGLRLQHRQGGQTGRCAGGRGADPRRAHAARRDARDGAHDEAALA